MKSKSMKEMEVELLRLVKWNYLLYRTMPNTQTSIPNNSQSTENPTQVKRAILARIPASEIHKSWEMAKSGWMEKTDSVCGIGRTGEQLRKKWNRLKANQDNHRTMKSFSKNKLWGNRKERVSQVQRHIVMVGTIGRRRRKMAKL